MWHVSTGPGETGADITVLRSAALVILEGVGDPSLGEWEEEGEVALHLRRRLSAQAEETGPVADIRRTPEAVMRALRLGGRLALAPPQMLADEVGLLG